MHQVQQSGQLAASCQIACLQTCSCIRKRGHLSASTTPLQPARRQNKIDVPGILICSPSTKFDLGAFLERSSLGMETQQPKLQVTFGGLLSKNIEQLKILNAAIFPIKYQVPPPSACSSQSTSL